MSGKLVYCPLAGHFSVFSNNFSLFLFFCEKRLAFFVRMVYYITVAQLRAMLM